MTTPSLRTCGLALALLVSTAQPLAAQARRPEDVPREFRAAWIATVANIDWPSRPGLSSAEQQQELVALFDQAQQLHLNAIVLQVRPVCDALYASPLEPWSSYLTGTQGKAPDPFYDPLELAVRLAHERGMELHAWFNPYRAKHPSSKGALAPGHVANAHPEIVRTYGDHLWLDPGHPSAEAHSLSVILDVVERYDLDGVHLDDYFYPYPSYAKGAPFPDDETYERHHRARGGRLNRADWRRDCVNRFVQNLYHEVKERKPWVKVGISPFGIYRPGIPEGIQSGIDQYEELYADPKRWLELGWLDYIAPQLYWPIAQTKQSYPVLLDWWISANRRGRHVWPGNFTSKVRDEKAGWSAAELVKQIEVTRSRKGATGNIHFSMKAFAQNYAGVTHELRRSVYGSKALVPESPWIAGKRPPAPRLAARAVENLTLKLDWSGSASEDVFQWALYVRTPQGWVLDQVLPASAREVHLTLSEIRRRSIDRVALTAVERAGRESRPVFHDP